MAQELEDLIIKVDSELGDLSGIDSAIGALNNLSQFSAKASKGADSLEKMASALTQLNSFGKSRVNFKKVSEDIEHLKGALESLANFSKDATKSIKQLSSLGKALESFTDIGKNLAGINDVTKGIERMVGVLEKLSRVEKDSTQGIKNLKSLGVALHEFNGLDDNVKALSDVAVGLMNLHKATELFKGYSKSDFGYLSTLGSGLKGLMESMGGTTRIWSTIGEVTRGITGLVEALKTTTNINVGQIGEIATQLKKFNDPEITSNATNLNRTLKNLSDSLTELNRSSGFAHDTMNKLISGFSSADKGFYNIRTSIEAISTDLTDALKPVRNSDLFDTLERFKHLNDSYKNVGGLGQGLGSLISALDMLEGRDLQTYGITQLLEYFKALAKDNTVDTAVQQMEKLGAVAQPIASLVNALKYTDFDNKNNVLTVLAGQINAFYNALPKDFSKMSYVLYAIKNIIEIAKDTNQTLPENNVITQLGKSLEGFKGFGDITALESFVRNITSLVGQIIEFTQSLDAHKGRDLADELDVSPILKVGEALKQLTSLEGSLNTFTKFTATLHTLAKMRKFTLGGLDITLGNLFDTLNRIPAGRVEGLKDLASVAKALTKLQDADPTQLNLIADALSKIFLALGHIQGSNNKINIKLDSSGVANFQKVVQQTSRSWDDFEKQLHEDLKNIDLRSMFNMDAPLHDLQRSLNEAERMLRQRLRTMQEEYEKMQNSRRVNANYQDSTNFRTQAGKYFTARVEAEQLKNIIEQLNVAIANAPRFNTYAEGVKYIRDLKDEYKTYQDLMERFNRGEQAGGTIGHRFDVIRERMEEIQQEIEKANYDLENSTDLLADCGELARIYADELNRAADASERASQEMRDSVGNGFGKFGSMLSGSKNGVLGSIGNLANMFGKAVQDGTAILGDNQLASLSQFAGTLGTVATAIGQVGAVVGVVVAIFKAWWNTMEKVKDALKQFIQKLIQFAKNMLSAVVGAFNAVSGAVSKVVSAVRSGAEAVASALRKIGEFGKGVISIFGKLGNAFAPAMKGIKGVLSVVTPKFVKTLASSNFQLSKILKQTHLLKSAIKTVTRYFSMISRMLMRKSITAFLNQMKQSFEDMVLFEMKADDQMLQLNYNVSIVFSALRRLANQVMAIFEPLINALATPAETFLTTLTTIAENAAKFMAILTGQPYYLRAKKFYNDYGEEVEDTTNKVKNLTNGLDELNILNDSKDSSKDDKPWDYYFEKVPVDGIFDMSGLKDIIDKIVDFLKNIDWEKLWDKLREIIHKIMEMVNYILSRLDLWEWLGKTLGNLFNTLMVAWNQFIKDFDPKLLADALTTFIINALQTINWELIHENIELTAKKFAQFWNEIFANQALWDEIAKAITNFLNEIVHYFDTWAWTFDFAQMAQTLTDAITKVLTGFDYEQLRHAVEGWIKGIVDFINTTAANKEFWKTLGESLAKLLNSTIIEAFKDLGDIDFADAVESLKLAIESFINGINWEDFWITIDKWAQNIADVINGLLADEEFLAKVTTMIAGFLNGIIELFDEALIKLHSYDIGKAIANALIAGLSDIHWNTIFMIPADAINALTNAIRGIFDALPEDFSLANWLIEHLSLTYDTIDWDGLMANLYEIGDRIIKFINDVIQSDAFWSRFGDLSVKVLNLVVKVTEDLTQIDWAGLAERITNFVNNIIGQHKIDDIIRNIGDVVINLAFSITAVIKGVDWGELGKQIAKGINGVIDKLYENRAKIRQDIIDAFTSFSTLVSSVLQDLLKSKAFAKLGTIIGEVLLGIINGLSIFFIDNKANIIASMKQFANSLAAYLRAHHDEIVDGLNVIIDALADIIRGFFDSKGELWAELNAILAELNLDNLISAIVEGIAQALAEAFADNQSLWESIGGIGGIVDILWSGVKRFIKTILESLFAKMRANLPRLIVSLMPDFGVVGGLKQIVMSILGFKNGKLDLSDEIEDADVTAKPSVLEKFANKVSNWWNNLWGKDKQTTKLPVEIEPEIDDDTKHQLEDVVGNVELQFEDAKLGKIKADEIEVTLFKGDKLEVEDIYAQTLTVVDIFAEKLHVGEIDGDMETIKKDMEDAFGGNRVDAEGGVLGAKRDAEFDKILARLLEITEKITVPLVEVAENITTPLIEAVKVLTDLIDAKKIKTKLLDAKKMTTKLLEAEKMWTKFLEIRDKIWTRELEVEERTTTKVLEVDEIVFNNDSLGELSADIEEVEKLVIRLIEAAKLVVDELEIGTLTAYEINVSTINADTLNVKDIYADTLTLGTIVADSLKVGSIDGGSISGTPSGTGVVNVGNWGYGGQYTIEKPQFNKGDRWSDISGAVPSAEDFLAGFADAYEFGSDAINNAWQNAIQTTSVQTPTYLGGNTTGYNSGSISSGSPITLDDVSLPAEAQYIKDYLTRAIGNEKGALGLLGNLYAESGLRSNNLQDTANTSLGLSDEQYTSLVNGGRDFTDNKGYGLAQWTTDNRKNKLLDYLDGRSVDDLEGQLGYLVKELQEDFPNVWKTLQNASSIHEASSAVLTGFEKPKNQSENQDALRWHYGETIGRALQGTEIPDEDVPTADVPEDGGDKQVDEFNLIDTGTTDVSGLTGYPFSFLDSLPIQTEFVMAEVYNIIDTWLGRIYKLFKSFKVDDFLKDLLDLKEIELNVDGLVGIKELEDIEKTLEAINEILKVISSQLDELLKKGIECNCTCDGGDDTHLINNTNAKSENTRAVEELNQTMRDLIDSIGDGISAYVDDITVDIGEIKVDVGDISAIAEATATAEADAWAKALDELKDIMSNITCHCDCDHEIVCQCNCGNSSGDLDSIIRTIQSSLGNITCNCTCDCNCGDCAMGHGGGTNIPDEPTPTGYDPYTPSGGNDGGGYNPTPSTPSGGTGRGGYDPYPYYPIGGGSYDPTPSTPSGGSSGGGNGGTDFMKWIKNGITKPLYVTLDGVRHLVTDTLPDVIKNRILNGEGTYDLDGTPIGKVKDSNASNKDFWLDKIKKWWGKTNQQLKDTDNNLAVWLNHDGLSEMVYAVVDGQRILLEDNLDDSMKKIIASGVDKLGNKIDFVTDTMNLNAEKRNKVLQWLHQKGWDKIKEATDNLTANADKNADKIGEKVDEVGDEVEKLDTTVKDSTQYLADNADKNADAINGTLDKNKDEINANNDKNTDKLCKNVDDNTDKLDESVKGAKDAILTGLTNGANLLKKGIDDNTNAVNNGANLIKDGVDKSKDAILAGIANGTNVLDKSINGLGGKIDAVKDSVNGLGGKIDGVNNSVIGLGGKLDAINGNVVGLGGKLDGINGNIVGLGGKLDGINGNIVGLGGKLDGINGSILGLNNGIAAINDGIGSLGGKLDGINGNIIGIGNTIGGIGGKLDSINGGIIGISNGIGGLGGKLDSINNGIGGLSGSIGGLGGKLDSISSGIGGLGNSIGGLGGKLDSISNGIGGLSGSIGNIGSSITNGFHQMQNALSGLSKPVTQSVINDGGYGGGNNGYNTPSSTSNSNSNSYTIPNVTTGEVIDNHGNHVGWLDGHWGDTWNFNNVQYGSQEEYQNAVMADAYANGDPNLTIPNVTTGEIISGTGQHVGWLDGHWGNTWNLDNVQYDNEADYNAALQKKNKANGNPDITVINVTTGEITNGKGEHVGWQDGRWSDGKGNKYSVVNGEIVSSKKDSDEITLAKAYISAISALMSSSLPASTYDKSVVTGLSNHTADAYLVLQVSSTSQADKTQAAQDIIKIASETGIKPIKASSNGTQINSENKELLKWDNPNKLTLSSYRSKFDNTAATTINVGGYAMGGTPNAGEIFIARENGTPEFVGSFGGKTAVANNDQIVTAVANGVSMANDRMISAIENQTNALESAIDRKNLDVQIGDRQIAEANNRGQKGLGNKFVD